MKDFESWEKIYEESRIKGFSEWEVSAVNEGVATKAGEWLLQKGKKLFGKSSSTVSKITDKTLIKASKRAGGIEKSIRLDILKDIIDDVAFNKIEAISKNIDNIQDKDIMNSLNNSWNSWMDEQANFFKKTTKSKRTRLDIKAFNQKSEKDIANFETQLKNITELINEHNRLKDIIEKFPGKSNVKDQLLKDLKKAKDDVVKATKNMRDLDASETLLSSANSRLDDIVEQYPSKFRKKISPESEEKLLADVPNKLSADRVIDKLETSSPQQLSDSLQKEVSNLVKNEDSAGMKALTENIEDKSKKIGEVNREKVNSSIAEKKKPEPEIKDGNGNVEGSADNAATEKEKKETKSLFKRFWKKTRWGIYIGSIIYLIKWYYDNKLAAETAEDKAKIDQEFKQQFIEILKKSNYTISLTEDIKEYFSSQSEADNVPNSFPSKDNIPNDLSVPVQENKLVDIFTSIIVSTYRNPFTYYSEEIFDKYKDSSQNILGYFTKLNNKNPENIRYIYDYLTKNGYNENNFKQIDNDTLHSSGQVETTFKNGLFYLLDENECKKEVSILIREIPEFISVFDNFKKSVFEQQFNSEIYTFLNNVKVINFSSDIINKMNITDETVKSISGIPANDNNMIQSYGIIKSYLMSYSDTENPLQKDGRFYADYWTSRKFLGDIYDKKGAVDGMLAVSKNSSSIKLESKILQFVYRKGLELAKNFHEFMINNKPESLAGMFNDWASYEASIVRSIIALCVVHEFCTLVNAQNSNESKKLLLNWDLLLRNN